MDALTLLTSRSSEKNLTLPAPNQEQLEKIFQAALHAPDHGKLKPYRFIVIENEGLSKLSGLLKSAVIELNLGEKRLQKAEKISQKAPMVIAVVAKIDKAIEKVQAVQLMPCSLLQTLKVLITFGLLHLGWTELNYAKHYTAKQMTK